MYTTPRHDQTKQVFLEVNGDILNITEEQTIEHIQNLLSSIGYSVVIYVGKDNLYLTAHRETEKLSEPGL